MDRALLVGTGGFGRCWWPALDDLADQVEVVAVVEPDEAEAAAAAARFGLTSERLLAPGSGDWSAFGASMVIDSSPPWHHPANLDRAAAAGLDVLVAKPMAVDLPTATRMVGVAERAGIRLAVAQQMRYFPCFLALREVVRTKLAGAVRAVRVRMALDGRGWTPGTEWRLAMTDPLLLEAGIHHFDLLRWCLDTELADVRATSWNPSDSPFAGDASVSAVLRTTNGVGIDYAASFAPRDEPAVRFDSGWTVFCDDAVLTVRDGGFYVDGVHSGAESTAEPVSLEELNTVLLKEWLAARASGGQPSFDGADNLRSLAVMQKAVESTREEPSS